MASRYWVGGTGTWDTSSTANWSATSGGAAGASAPTTNDQVFFNALSGGGTVTLGSNVIALTAEMTGFTGTLDFSTFKIQLSGFNGADIFKGGTTFSTAGNRQIEIVYATTGTIFSSVGNMSEANAISFTLTTGEYTFAPNGVCAMRDYTVSARTTNMNVLGASTLIIYGNLTLNAPGLTTNSNTSSITFAATSGTQTITTNGTTVAKVIAVDAPNASVQLADNLATTQIMYLANGTFNANNKNIDAPSIQLLSGVKTLSLGSGTITISGSGASAFNANTNGTGLTVSPSTATINMTSASAKTFAGGAKTWPTLNQGGAGALTIQQSNTFANITNTVQPATITLTAGTTQTVTDFDVSGTSGNLITLNSSSAGSQATLTDSGGVNSVSYVSIKDVSATGYGEWQAYTSNGNVDGGNNAGWVFSAPPSFVASEYFPELRSFTEKRRF